MLSARQCYNNAENKVLKITVMMPKDRVFKYRRASPRTAASAPDSTVIVYLP
jgi:hypothetical protein